MTLLGIFCLFTAAFVGLCLWLRYYAKKQEAEYLKSEKYAKYQRQKAFEERLYKLTPNDTPLFFYNTLQKTLSLTTHFRMTNEGSGKIRIATPAGDKFLVEKTASINLECGDEDNWNKIFDHIIKRIVDCNRDPNDISWYGLIRQARNRLFRLCEDLYVQLGTKTPPGVTRVKIERLNTRCYSPNEVWEALEADILREIQSRTQIS
jgi:hypothetical protein